MRYEIYNTVEAGAAFSETLFGQTAQVRVLRESVQMEEKSDDTHYDAYER